MSTEALHAAVDPAVPEGAVAPGGRQRVHAVVFEDPLRTLEAVRRLRASGFDVFDVHSPFPIHGMEDALGLRPTRLGISSLVGGVVGALVALSLQLYTHAVDWPLVIGGKSPLAVPAKIPVSFELTVLFSMIGTVGGLLVRRKLYPFPADPVTQPHPAVTDDRFVVLVLERDASFEPSRFAALCEALSAVERRDAWRVL